MKHVKRLTALLLVMLTVLSFATVSADAATKFTAITPGKTYTMKMEKKEVTESSGWSSYIDNSPYYKLTLKSASVVKISWTGNKGNHPTDIYFYTDAAMKNPVTLIQLQTAGSKGSESIVLTKGTYYIKMYDGYVSPSGFGTTKVTFKVSQVVNKANYCQAKAVALKAGSTVTIASTAAHDYSRWYKIKLTGKKAISVYTTEDDGYRVTIYNSKMQRLSTTSGSKQVTTQDKQPKGTYYIRVSAYENSYYYNNPRLGDYMTLKWK